MISLQTGPWSRQAEYDDDRRVHMVFRAKTTSLTSSLASLAISILISSSALAQSSIDPSSALLLSPSTRSTGRTSERTSERTSPDVRGDSTRYTIRPRSTSGFEKPLPTPQPKQAVSEPAASPAPTPAPVVLTPNENGSVVVAVDPPTVENAPSESASSPTETAPETTAESSSANRHMLEVSIASAYLYENADSNYSYRQENMGGPAYAASARAWLVSEFAVGGRFFSTLGGQISDRGTAVSASRTELAYGAYFRKRFSTADMVFSAEYVTSEFKVSSDAVSKLKTKSSGIRVGIESEFQTLSGSWTLGFSVTPKLQHEEIPAATQVRSGTGVNAYAVGASISRRWKLDGSNAVFVSLEHNLERDLFTGSVSASDPVTGATPNGAAATIGTTLIQFGYGWGD